MLGQAISNAEANLKIAMYELDAIIDEAQKSHHLSLVKQIELRKTLKSVRCHLIDAADAHTQQSGQPTT